MSGIYVICNHIWITRDRKYCYVQFSGDKKGVIVPKGEVITQEGEGLYAVRAYEKCGMPIVTNSFNNSLQATFLDVRKDRLVTRNINHDDLVLFPVIIDRPPIQVRKP